MTITENCGTAQRRPLKIIVYEKNLMVLGRIKSDLSNLTSLENIFFSGNWFEIMELKNLDSQPIVIAGIDDNSEVQDVERIINRIVHNFKNAKIILLASSGQIPHDKLALNVVEKTVNNKLNISGLVNVINIFLGDRP
jgi:hypothetical protein